MKTNMKMDTMEARKNLFNMINNPHIRLSAMIGQIIAATTYVIDDVETANQETGEIQQVKRLVIMDKAGETYHTMARGLLDSFQRIIDVFGDDWGEGFGLVVKQINTSAGRRTFTFDVV